MQTLRNNPVLAIALLVVAVVALAISFYFAFVREAAPQSPFSQDPANPPATQPKDTKPEGGHVVF
jgi:hypothetical protein